MPGDITSIFRPWCDAIEVSAGTPEGARRNGWDRITQAPIPEGRFLNHALTIKDKVRCPVISVEGWRDPARIAQALRWIDAVSMCRPFIREPHLAARSRDCDLTPAKCQRNRRSGRHAADGREPRSP